MEQQQQLHGLAGTSDTGIGLNKYNFLKSLPSDSLTESEKQDMADYEERHHPSIGQSEKQREYVRRLFIDTPTVSSVVSKGYLWRSFLENFREIEGKEFEQNPDTIGNVKTVMLYFLRHDDFLFCDNLNAMSKPSFDKGLLIVGDYGCGKTSVMKAIQKSLEGIRGYHFRCFNANEVVEIFESITTDTVGAGFSRKQFYASMTTGAVLFDDVKTERIASNFGKANIFREIFEIRSQKDFKTYVTCNFDEKKPGDVVAAVDEFGRKYGERVYDRIFEMFNIIEFRGKSFRK